MTSDEWTAEWPTVPGWYWVWKASERPDVWPMREPARVRWAGLGKDRHLLYTGMGAILYESEWTGLRWGPRIDVPDAPDGTPGTRYAVASMHDGDMVYLDDYERWTSARNEARIFDTRNDAESMVSEDERWGLSSWVEPIDDLVGFRNMEDTLL